MPGIEENARHRLSGQNLGNHVAVDVGQSPVDAVVAEGQPGVIDAEEVAALRADAMSMQERAPVGPESKVDAQGRPALGLGAGPVRR